MTLEEKGAYSIVLDLIYDRQKPIPDDAAWIAGHCGCSVRKWNSLRAKLLERGKLVDLGGMLSNQRAVKEIADGLETSRKFAENGRKGGFNKAENYRGFKKLSTLALAGLQHTRDQRLKLEKGWGMDEGLREVSRVDQPTLFAACEKLTGVPVPGMLTLSKFPESIVKRALEDME